MEISAFVNSSILLIFNNSCKIRPQKCEIFQFGRIYRPPLTQVGFICPHFPEENRCPYSIRRYRVCQQKGEGTYAKRNHIFLCPLAGTAGIQSCHHPEIYPCGGTFFRDTRSAPLPAKETVAAWRDDLVRRGYAVTAVNALLAAVNRYQDFCGNPAGKARPLKCQRRVFCDADRELSRAEYFRLLQAARNSGQQRILLILQTLCATGIRVSELRAITRDAVRRRKATIRCKGKCREILLPAELCRRLETWCRRHRIHTGAVFVTRTGTPVDRSNIWKDMKALCDQAGVARKKVFPHNLRHLFARTFYKMERDLAKLADVLGHSSIETTRIYIMESGAEHERLLNRMHLLL